MQNIEPKLKGIDKYFITPEYNNKNKKTYLNIIENILILGVKMIQFRSKNLDEKSYNKLAAEEAFEKTLKFLKDWKWTLLQHFYL